MSLSTSSSVLILIFLCFGLTLTFDTEWELNQFSIIEVNPFYEIKKFNTTEDVIKDAQNYTKEFMSKSMIPGLVIGMSIKGKIVWRESFGHIDIENNVTTDKDSVWRLASISKPLTTALVGQLIDRGLLDLNASIYKYISEDLFPKKVFNGKPVDISVRQLCSHMAGLHLTKVPNDFSTILRAENVSQTILGLKNENLLYKPGTVFSYSNYGFQMVGAVIEAVLKKPYQSEIKKMFISLGMNSTFAETRDEIFKHRPRYYSFSQKQPVHLENTDIIDDLFSYEGWWPSAGIASTVADLLTFGNAMLSASKGQKKEFLSQSTANELWRPETIGIPKAKNFSNNEYGKGWFNTDISQSVDFPFNDYPYKKLIWHSGGLLGTSTMLTLFPEQNIVGVVFSNLGSTIGLDQLLLYVAKNFKDFL